METLDDKEQRIADIEALFSESKRALHVMFGTKQYQLMKTEIGGATYRLIEGGGMIGAIDPQKNSRDEIKLPSLVLYLDEALNILGFEPKDGKKMAQQTVYDIIDKIIEQYALNQLRG